MSNIKIVRNGKEILFKSFLFPGGEVGIKLDTDSVGYIAKTGGFAESDYQTIIARIQNTNDILRLMMVKDALDRLDDTPTKLFMPYVPYGRQDRVCNKGESFSLKVFGNLINSLNFKEVIVVDPHSNVTEAVINNIKVITQFDIINKWTDFLSRIFKGVIFVSPDAGSNKKTSEIAGFFNHSDFIRADKLRDLSNGNIKETIVYADDLKGKDVCILDDIGDGMRTFLELAKVLKSKNCGNIIVYVTHGIFSKGTKICFNNGIDEIWTTDSYHDLLPNDCDRERIKVLKLEEHFKL